MKKRKGISMVILVITILVMVILAGVVIFMLTKNNPVERAKLGKTLSNARIYENDLAKNITQMEEEQDTVETENALIAGEAMKKYIPSLRKEDLNKFVIANGYLEYLGNEPEIIEKLKDTNIIVNAPFKTETIAKEIRGNGSVGFLDNEVYLFNVEENPDKTLSREVKTITVLDKNLNEIKTHTLKYPLYNSNDPLKQESSILPLKNELGERCVIGTTYIEGDTGNRKAVLVNLETGVEKRIFVSEKSYIDFAKFLPDGSIAVVSRNHAREGIFNVIDSDLQTEKVSYKVVYPSTERLDTAAYIEETNEIVLAGMTSTNRAKVICIDANTGNENTAKRYVSSGASAKERAHAYQINGEVYILEMHGNYETHVWRSINGYKELGRANLESVTTKKLASSSVGAKILPEPIIVETQTGEPLVIVVDAELPQPKKLYVTKSAGFGKTQKRWGPHEYNLNNLKIGAEETCAAFKNLEFGAGNTFSGLLVTAQGSGKANRYKYVVRKVSFGI